MTKIAPLAAALILGFASVPAAAQGTSVQPYGAPTGDALAKPANPAAMAQENADGPDLSVAPQTRTGGTAATGTVVVDEPPLRQLNDAGTAATSSKIGIGPAPEDSASQEDLERLGEVPDTAK